MEYVLKAKEIEKRFDDREEVLKGIDLEVEENTFTVLLGPSGSGKSTLLNILSGMLKPSKGEVWYKELEISALSEKQMADWKRKYVGNVFQNYMLLNNLTVRENILLGVHPKKESLLVEDLAQQLGITSFLNKFPFQLSGGQQQRVSIARAVIKKPEVLFCDEATGALDEENSKNVVQLLHELRKKYHITILFVTHNQQIAETANRVITIKNGIVASNKYNENPIAPMDMKWGE